MADLLDVLGAFIGDQAPVKNPKYQGIDQSGNYIGGESPYLQSGFGTKLLHPAVAAQTGQLNNAAYDSFIKNTIGNKIGEANTAEAMGGYGKDPSAMSIPALARLVGNNPTSGNIYSTAVSGANIANNLPAKQSAADLAAANYQVPKFQSDTRLIPLQEQFATGELNGKINLQPLQNTYNAANLQSNINQIPSEEVANISRNNYTRDSLAAKTKEIQPALANALKGYSNDNVRLGNERNILDVDSAMGGTLANLRANENMGNLYKTQVDTALASDNAANIPSLARIQGAHRNNTLREALTPETAKNPFYVAPDGTKKLNPFYASEAEIINAQLGNIPGNKSSIPSAPRAMLDASGMPVDVPPASIYATSAPAKITPTIATPVSNPVAKEKAPYVSPEIKHAFNSEIKGAIQDQINDIERELKLEGKERIKFSLPKQQSTKSIKEYYDSLKAKRDALVKQLNADKKTPVLNVDWMK